MTQRERVEAVLAHEAPDRVPVVPQAFLLAARTAGTHIGEINRDGRLLAKSHIACQEKYGYDGVVVDVDDASMAEACGARVVFREDDVAVVDESEPVLTDLKQIRDMVLPDPRTAGRLPEWLLATEELVAAIGSDVFIMGRADQGPFSLACLLRGTTRWMLDLIEADPAEVAEVLVWCREAILRFAVAQRECGAHATSIGDAYAGPNLISPDMYRQHARDHETWLAQRIQREGFPFSLHICGNTTSILEDMVATGSAILEIDSPVDLSKAADLSAGRAVLMGNINPSHPLVFGTPETVRAHVRHAIETTGCRDLLLSSGCAMGRDTPEENMRALVSAAAEFGSADKVADAGGHC